MIKILFVCHGNICRSPMAEFVMKKLLKDAGKEKEIFIESAATSTEEIGNDMYPPAKAMLNQVGIPFTRRGARQITAADYDKYDYLIGMDEENLYYMNRRWNNDPAGKVHLLLEYAGKNREVADPWYTGDFNATYLDIMAGCTGLLARLSK